MLHRRLDRLEGALADNLFRSAAKLAASRSGTGTREELLAEVARLQGLGTFGFEDFKPGRIRSEQLNRQYDRLYTTLDALFTYLNKSSRSIARQSQLTNSDLDITEQGVLRLLEDATIFKILKLNRDWNDVRLLSFRDGRNYSISRLRAEVDSRAKLLTQKLLRKRVLNARSGNFTPGVTVELLSEGASKISRSDFAPEDAIDPDTTTAWIETLLTDRPITTVYNGTTYAGFVARLTVDYKQIDTINTIQLLPFCYFPSKVLNLEYSTNGVNYSVIPDFAVKTSTLGWFSYRFAPALIRFIRVTLLQENYRRQVFSIPDSTLNRNQLINQLADENFRKQIGNRVASEVEERLADFDADAARTVDNLSRIDQNILDLVTMKNTTDRTADLKKAIRTLSEGEAPELLHFDKCEYVLGMQHFEPSFCEYTSVSDFVSPSYTAEGSLIDLAVEVTSTAPRLQMPSQYNLLSSSVVELDVELGPNRISPLVPYKAPLLKKSGTSVTVCASYAVTGYSNPVFPTDEIEEVLRVDQSNRVAKLRFDPTSIRPKVYRNGQLLGGTDTTYSQSAATVTIVPEIFLPSALYVAKYTPVAGQDKLDVRALYNSIVNRVPEKFAGTDASGKITLSLPPFVDFGVINRTGFFYKPEEEARYYCRRDAGQILSDGQVYGSAETKVQADADVGGSSSISATTVSIVANTGAGNPNLVNIGFYAPGTGDPPGILQIENELVAYTGISFTTFTGCKRGIQSTAALAHANAVPIAGIGRMVYEPITVFIDGVRARNITNYETGEHPAFAPTTSNTRVQDYLQSGPNIFFSNPLPGINIEVQYGVLAHYTRLRMRLMSCMPGTYGYTSEVKEARIYMNRAEE